MGAVCRGDTAHAVSEDDLHAHASGRWSFRCAALAVALKRSRGSHLQGQGLFQCNGGTVPKVMWSSSRLGEVSRIMKLNHVGSVLEGIDPDVLPLPVDEGAR